VRIASDWSVDAPLVIAHRGASAYAPENTLPAFHLAGAMRADAIELDAKLSADGVVVIMHDPTLDRTTDGQGPVGVCTLEELKHLDAGSRFSKEYSGVRIPTLREVLAEIAAKLLVNIEMTNYTNPRDLLPEAVTALVKELDLERRVLLSSFHPLALLRARNLAPTIPLGLLVGKGQPSWQRLVLRALIPHQAYHPFESVLRTSDIRGNHRRGRRVHVWTVNAESRIREVVCAGADGVITDVPDLARRVCDESKPTS